MRKRWFKTENFNEKNVIFRKCSLRLSIEVPVLFLLGIVLLNTAYGESLISLFKSNNFLFLSTFLFFGIFSSAIFSIFDKKTITWHAIEHKVSKLINERLPISKDILRSIDPADNMCGGFMSFFFLIFSFFHILLSFIFQNGNSWILFGISIFISYTVFFTPFPHWLQRKTLMAEPEDWQYEEALKVSLEIEEWTKKTKLKS